MLQKHILTMLAKVRRGYAGLPRARLCTRAKPKEIKEDLKPTEEDDGDGWPAARTLSE